VLIWNHGENFVPAICPDEITANSLTDDFRAIWTKRGSLFASEFPLPRVPLGQIMACPIDSGRFDLEFWRTFWRIQTPKALLRESSSGGCWKDVRGIASLA
jgi:hypothetical protein